jgi:hypothetical protein
MHAVGFAACVPEVALASFYRTWRFPVFDWPPYSVMTCFKHVRRR